ncbi:unnamed protein product [Musa acuminata subsp. burmannicoides]
MVSSIVLLSAYQSNESDMSVRERSFYSENLCSINNKMGKLIPQKSTPVLPDQQTQLLR